MFTQYLVKISDLIHLLQAVFFLELMNVIATGPRGGLLGPLGSLVGDATTKLDLLLGPGRVVLVRLFLRVLPKKHFAEKTQL